MRTNTSTKQVGFNFCKLTNPFHFILMLLLAASFSSYAADVRVYTFDSQGNPIAGEFKIQKGPNFIGTFNSGDTANLTTGDTYKIWAIYESTSTERVNLTVSAAGDSLAFHTTNVKFHFSGGYLDYRGSGSWRSFGKDTTTNEWQARELFPFDFYGDTMRINTGYVWNDVRGVQFDIYYKGLTSVEKTISVLRVWDSYGSPISGATARGGYATPTVWHVPGSTNANGLLLDLRNGKQTNLSYEAKVNNTTAVEGPKDPTLDSYYLFQTDKLVLNFQTCAGDGIAGANVRYGNGANYSTWWFPNGPTDSIGRIIGQVFPGTYSFEMQYKATADQKISVVIPDGGDSLIWNSVSVNLSSSSSISYGGANGVSTWFTQPSMELLPGTYKFKFNSTGEVKDLTLSGCNFTKTEALVDVLDCDGNNQDSVNIKWYKYGNAGNKIDAGLTGNSTMSLLIDSGITKIGVVANYLGQNNTLIQTLSVNNHFVFQMMNVEVSLYNHDSTIALVPQAVKFYVYGQAGNKMIFPSSLNKCLLPGKYGFVVSYNNTSAERNGIDVEIENPVLFQTGLVDDLDECSFDPTQYYAYGNAGSKYPFVDPMEFMASKVIILSSSNPSKTITVVSSAIHRLDTCASLAIMDSCVSDSSWKMSTVVTPSDWNGTWSGVSSLPHDSTFTLPTPIGQPYFWGGIPTVPGSSPVVTGNDIRYFKKNFGLTDTTGLEARFRMYMDDGAEIWVNGHPIAREEDMAWENFNGVPHDLLINDDHSVNNGYLGGDPFDFTGTLHLDTVLRKNLNTVIVVIRNPMSPTNLGGFSFRMDITKNGESVLVKKKKEVNREVEAVLAVYPNPTNQSIFIDFDELNLTSGLSTEVAVFNINGQLMIHEVTNQEQDIFTLNLIDLKTGLYFIKLVNGNQVHHAKVIKR